MSIFSCRSLLIFPLFTFSGNVDLTTPFGGVGIKANLGGTDAAQTNILTTAVIGLGVLILIDTLATVVTPYFSKKDETVVDTGNKTATSRSMRNLFQQTTLDTLENAVVETLLKAKDKYL